MIYHLLRGAEGSAVRELLTPRLSTVRRAMWRVDRTIKAWRRRSRLRSGDAAGPAEGVESGDPDRTLDAAATAELRSLDALTDKRLLDVIARRRRRLDAEQAAGWVSRVMGAFHEDDVARFYGEYSLTKQMDYDKHDIYLLYSSEFIKLRLQSCRKEPFTVAWVEEFVKPGDVFYDVGANVGAYSLIAAKFTEGRARVFALEPSFPTYTDLCRNVLLNRCEDSIIPLPIALWSSNELKTFHYRTLEPGAAKQGLHLTAGSPQSVYREPVLALRLDDLPEILNIPAPNHIKIDVDGPELVVLEGADRTLSDPQLQSVMIEIMRKSGLTVMDTKVGKLLHSKGFRLRSEHRRDKRRSPHYGVFVRA
jgi:FkbM family methyltransferase